MASKLIMAANSLGNVNDIPKRSLEALHHADLLIFEEDKIARQTLKAAGLHKPYLCYNEHHQTHTLETMKLSLFEGKTVVYMCDQGTPNFADPGGKLIQVANEVGAKIEVIPGPNSVSAAISACPFVMDNFLHAGFLVRQPAKRQAQIKKLLTYPFPLILMDTPYRRDALLADVAAVAPKATLSFLAINIGMEDEQYLCAPIEELQVNSKSLGKNANFVLILQGSSQLKR